MYLRSLNAFAAAAVLATSPFCVSTSLAASVTQTNLVSDGAVSAPVTDAHLVNPWGMANAPGGAYWISDNATGLTTLYDGAGTIQPLVVAIPSATAGGVGSPTGQVFNGSADFAVTEGAKTGAGVFLFPTEDGTVSGWAPSVDFANAVIAVNHAAEKAVYKAIAIVPAKTGNVLLVTNFRSGFVEMYDGNFKPLGQFRDQGSATVSPVPLTYAPYNVQYLGGHIFVTYARQDSAKHDSISKAGFGYVDEVTVTGKLIRRIASQGASNAPWGLAIAPKGWGTLSGALLVGNFGDGAVNAYKISTGTFLGSLTTTGGSKLWIDGLWGLSQGATVKNGDVSAIYFTAGPDGETHGLFGKLNYTP